MWTYNAAIIKVVDGDTLDLRVDLGFKVFINIRVRLARIDAPEMSTDAGKALKTKLEPLLGESVVIQTSKGDRYGRWIAEVTLPNDMNLSDHLLSAGLAVEYRGS